MSKLTSEKDSKTDLLTRIVFALDTWRRWNEQHLKYYIRNTINSFEQVSVHDVQRVIRDWERRIARPLTVEETAEQIAFDFRTMSSRNPLTACPWNTYFCPVCIEPDPSTGKYFPDITLITPKVMEYWKKRANEETIPLLRARYADLVWDLENITVSSSKKPEYGKISIKAYQQIAYLQTNEFSIQCISGLKRALSIAAKMKDKQLFKSTVGSLISYEKAISQDNLPGTWGSTYEILKEYRNDRYVVLTISNIISDLASRYVRLITNPSANVESIFRAFQILADTDKVSCGTLNKNISESFIDWIYSFAMQCESPLQTQHHLIRAYFVLHNRHINDCLEERLLCDCEKVGLQVIDSLNETFHSAEISKEDLDSNIEILFRDGTRTALLRIAATYLVREQALRDKVSAGLEGLIWYQIAPPIELDGFGRPINAVDAFTGDDSLMYHFGKEYVMLEFHFVHIALTEHIARSDDSVTEIMEHCYTSPLFDPSRKELIKSGLGAYVDGDYISCISILVPEIEHLIRFTTKKLQIPTWEPNRGNTFNVKTLGTLMRDDRIRKVIGDIHFEISLLFSDTRGFNIRNEFCHGLLDVQGYNQITSSMLVHILLCVGLIRERESD